MTTRTPITAHRKLVAAGPVAADLNALSHQVFLLPFSRKFVPMPGTRHMSHLDVCMLQILKLGQDGPRIAQMAVSLARADLAFARHLGKI